MTEERIDSTTPESNLMPSIPESDSLIPLSEGDSAVLIPESDSAIISDDVEPKFVPTRSNSTGNVDVPYARVKILSRYLSASSIASCHDYCKYGKEDINPEIKVTSPRTPKLKRITEMEGKGQEYMEKSETPRERQKKFATLFASSNGARGQNPDIPPSPRSGILSSSSSSKRERVLSKQLSLPNKPIDVSAIRAIDLKMKPLQSKSSSLPVKCATIKEDEEVQERKESGSSVLKDTHKSSSGTKHGVKKSKSTVSLSAIQSVKKALMQPLVSLSHKRTNSKRISNINPERLKKLEGITCLKDENDGGNGEPYHQPNIKDVPEKTLRVIESGTPTTPLENGQKSSKRTKNGNLATQMTVSSENKSFRHSKDGNRRSSISSLASLTSSKSSNSQNPETNGADMGNKEVNTKVETKSRQRKGTATNAKDFKESPGKKLSFRTGKVVELPSDTNSPRKLKFKRRAISDVQYQLSKSDILEKGSLKSTSVDDSQINIGESAEKVVLRRHDAEGKKPEQGSWNNMIEETATKLVETRKSKVKALVGAFETVISLQDTKTSSTVGA